MGAQGVPGLGLVFEIRHVSADTSIAMPAAGGVLYLVRTDRRGVTMTLPPLVGGTSRLVTITREDGGQKVAVQPSGADTLSGAKLPLTLDERYESVTLVSHGTEWAVLFRSK
jgi:hypothetical protein